MRPATPALAKIVKRNHLWLVALALFGAALLPAWLLNGSDLAGPFANAQNVFYNALACAALFYAARRTHPHSPVAAAAWMSLAIAQILYLAGDSIYLILDDILHVEPYPSLADFFYLLYYPAYLVAILHFPIPRQTRPEKIQMLFQAAIVALAASLYTWYFLVVPLIADVEVEPVALAINVAYPLVDLLMVLAVMVLIFRQSETDSPIPLLFLMAEACVTVGADFSFSYLSLHSETPAGGLTDFTYQTGHILLILAALVQGLHGHERYNSEHHRLYRMGRTLMRALTPNFWLAAVFLLLINSHNTGISTNFNQISVWVGVIIAVAIAFQLALTHENQRLTATLTAANADLEQRVEARTRELARANTALSLEVQERRLASEALSISREQYRAVVEDLPVLICRFLPSSVLTFANAAYCRYYGRTNDELVGFPFLDLVPPSEREAVEGHYLALSPEHPTDIIEHQVVSPAGELRWQRWINRAIYEDGYLVEYQAIGEDITERRQAENALRESEEKFRDLFDNSSDLIQIIAPDGHIIFVNNAWRAAMGYSSDELQRMTFWDLLDLNSRAAFYNLFEIALSGRPLDNIEAIFVSRSGQYINVEGNINCALDAEGRPQHLRAIFHNITQRKQTEAQLMHQAYYDSLTGLPNRARFLQRLGHAIASRASFGETNPPDCAVLFLDLDNFKYINDSLGHTAGDQLLIQIGERLLACVRSHDMVARIGGDEFVFLFEHITESSIAIQAADRILEALRAPFTIQGHSVSVSGSIGVVLGDRIFDVEGALRDADIAMYQAKNQGKNRYFTFEPSLRAMPMERMRLENDLRLAQEHGELRLYYQPVMRLPDRRLAGFEALLRWQHPERGLLGPADFIPLAEETGLIVPIGAWALRQACQQLYCWQQMHTTAPITMSVNLSARQLMHPDVIAEVHAAIFENGLQPTDLALELTESVILEDFDHARSVLTALSDMGVSIYLDDFGSGYSSLARLQRLPIDAIKIDRTFVQEMTPLGENMEILRAITALGKELRLKVIAEGIEQLFHLENLVEIGCILGQGFFFSRPIPPDEAEARYLNPGE